MYDAKRALFLSGMLQYQVNIAFRVDDVHSSDHILSGTPSRSDLEVDTLPDVDTHSTAHLRESAQCARYVGTNIDGVFKNCMYETPRRAPLTPLRRIKTLACLQVGSRSQA
jgi:hypothetical protein